MDPNVVDMDRAIHKNYNPNERFPFSRRALIEQIRSDFYTFIRLIRNYASMNPLFFFFLLIMLPITVFAVQSTVSYLGKAAPGNTANLTFSPSVISVPPQKTVKIMLDSGKRKIAFAKVVFSFDTNKIRLASEISTNPQLSYTVEKSSMQQANAAGKATVVIAAAPTDTNNLPSGIFEFASFSLDAKSASFASTNVNFIASDVQIVDINVFQLNPVTAGLKISSSSNPPVSTNQTATPTIGTQPTGVSVPNQSLIKFSPSTVNIPPDSPVKIIINSPNKQIVFARVVFSFDKSKIKLTSEIAANPNFSTVVQKSTMQDANSQGRAVIVVATSPTDSKPQGIFDFASFSIGQVSANTGNTVISFDTGDMQIVDLSGQVVNLPAESLQINASGGPISPPRPTVPPPNPNPSQACQNIASQTCFIQWFREYVGVETTKFADLNKDGKVDLIDFEIRRRAAFP